MKIIKLDSFAQVREYGFDWNNLLSHSKDNHVFLTLEWLETWWKHFGANRKLLLLAVEDNNRLLAIAPLMESTYRLFGVTLRNIEFIGSPVADYHGFILLEESMLCTRMILDYIKQQSWDVLELKNIPEKSDTAMALQANLQGSIKLKAKDMETCFYIPLPNKKDEYLQQLDGKMKKDFRRNIKRLEKEHKVEFKFFDQIGSVKEAMEAFIKLHQLRWESIGKEGRFSDLAFNNFHLEVAERFSEKGWLSLCFLTVDGKPVSADYCFEYGRKTYCYLTGFDPSYSIYGVGSLCNLYSIQASIERNLDEYDLLRGAHSYKNEWNSLNRKNLEVSAIRNKPIPKAYERLVKSNLMSSMSRMLRKRALSNMVKN